jgi:hypothetical protein
LGRAGVFCVGVWWWGGGLGVLVGAGGGWGLVHTKNVKNFAAGKECGVTP